MCFALDWKRVIATFASKTGAGAYLLLTKVYYSKAEARNMHRVASSRPSATGPGSAGVSVTECGCREAHKGPLVALISSSQVVYASTEGETIGTGAGSNEPIHEAAPPDCPDEPSPRKTEKTMVLVYNMTFLLEDVGSIR
ncbi:hypothetical protein A9K55_008419 [Cordyceps militaris]|uniref:Uncharacterized protein n=1 Tax=Cordyceps militaris TaxID=73501 RepID=A0A2H4SJJ0_CORMI|nr:hypothetical protein A9K55_008419 [Cordyceps militaris]